MDFAKVWTMKLPRATSIVLLLLILSTGLRLYTLGDESLWLDEGLTMYTVSSYSLMDLLTGKANVNQHSPLFEVIVKVWTLVVGTSVYRARLVSVFFGISSVFFIYKLGELIGTQKVGLIAATLLSFSPLHVYYSQELRNYSMLVFFTVLSTYFLLQSLKKNQAIDLILLTIFVALGLYSHSMFQFVFGSLSIFALMKSLSAKRGYWCLAPFAIALLLLLPWSLSITVDEWSRISPGGQTSIQQATEISKDLFGLPPGNFLQLREPFLKKPLHSIVAMATIAIALFLLFYSPKKELIYWMGPLIVAISLLAIFLFEKTVGTFPAPGLTSKHLIFLLPFLLIWIAQGLEKMPNSLLILALLLILIPNTTSLDLHYDNLTKENWRGVANYIEREAQADEYIVIFPSYLYQPLQFYLANTTKRQPILLPKYWTSTRNLPDEFMLVTSSAHTPYADPKGIFLDALDLNYESYGHTTFSDAKIDRLRRTNYE